MDIIRWIRVIFSTVFILLGVVFGTYFYVKEHPLTSINLQGCIVRLLPANDFTIIPFKDSCCRKFWISQNRFLNNYFQYLSFFVQCLWLVYVFVVISLCAFIRSYIFRYSVKNEFASFDGYALRAASYVACRTKNRTNVCFFRQQHDACQKGTPL